MSKTVIIGLDCAPCTPRPDTYIEGVIKDTGLDINKGKIVSKLFGAWKWVFPLEENNWDTIESIVKQRVELLYEEGKIRGGVWDSIEE